jgi:hypothetical protein
MVEIFLGSVLERKTIVKVFKMQDRFTEAQTRLSEAEKQLSQANLVISEIKMKL